MRCRALLHWRACHQKVDVVGEVQEEAAASELLARLGRAVQPLLSHQPPGPNPASNQPKGRNGNHQEKRKNKGKFWRRERDNLCLVVLGAPFIGSHSVFTKKVNFFGKQ